MEREYVAPGSTEGPFEAHSHEVKPVSRTLCLLTTLSHTDADTEYADRSNPDQGHTRRCVQCMNPLI